MKYSIALFILLMVVLIIAGLNQAAMSHPQPVFSSQTVRFSRNIEFSESSGNIRCVSLTETSSARRKRDIVPLTGALDMTRQLHGVRFRWEDALGGRQDIGFIAEEVEPVIPEVVHRDGSGESVLGMDYGHVTAVAIEAIKELDAELAAHRDQLDEHSGEIEKLWQLSEDGGSDGGGIAGGGATSFVSVSGNGFQPREHTITFLKGFDGVRGTTAAAFVQFFATVDLPHGATVTGLEAQILDNDAVQNMSLSLGFVTDGGGAGSMATLASSGTGGTARTFSTTTITQGEIIDNQKRSYHISANWTVPSPSFNLKLVRAHVTFTLP